MDTLQGRNFTPAHSEYIVATRGDLLDVFLQGYGVIATVATKVDARDAIREHSQARGYYSYTWTRTEDGFVDHFSLM